MLGGQVSAGQDVLIVNVRRPSSARCVITLWNYWLRRGIWILQTDRGADSSIWSQGACQTGGGFHFAGCPTFQSCLKQSLTFQVFLCLDCLPFDGIVDGIFVLKGLSPVPTLQVCLILLCHPTLSRKFLGPGWQDVGEKEDFFCSSAKEVAKEGVRFLWNLGAKWNYSEGGGGGWRGGLGGVSQSWGNGQALMEERTLV